MKTFNEWLVENHPEVIEEGFLDSLGKNKLLKKAALVGSLALGGAGIANKSFGANPSPSKVSQKAEEDDLDFISGDEDIDSEIEQEKQYMLRKANQVPTRTTQQNNVVVSRGSGKIVGGKVVPGKSAVKVPDKVVQKPLSKLPSGPGSSPEFRGSAE